MEDFRKILVFGTILLFVGMSIVPVVGSISRENRSSTGIQLLDSSSRDDNDTTPPVTTHFFNGTKGENGFYISDVEVTLNATDDISGVNVTYYNLDVPPIQMIYTGPFWVRKEAGHLVCYWSVDNAGNVEDWKCFNIHIDLYPPTVDLWYQMTPQGWKFIADAYDSMSMVDRVEFYLDDELMFTDFYDPYEWDSNLTGEGFWIKAIAYDRAGHQAEDQVWVRTSRVFVKEIICRTSSQTQIQSSSQQSSNHLLLRFLKHHPRMFPILRQIIGWK